MIKIRRACILHIVLMLIFSYAEAEVFQGSTTAGQTVRIAAEQNVSVREVLVRVGDFVSENQVLATLQTHAVYCNEDGTVSLQRINTGEKAAGTVLQIAPRHTYKLYCTAEKAYNSSENRFIHTGEILYAKCTHNGTHRAQVQVVSVDGETYEARSLGGELFIGETVNLYRDSQFTSEQKVGVATVTAADLINYDIDGYLLNVNVKPGERVQRGELLFTWCECTSSNLAANTEGIVYFLSDADPNTAWFAEIVPFENVRISITVSEEQLNTIRKVKHIAYLRSDDITQSEHEARIEKISFVSDEQGYCVTLIPQNDHLPIGLSVEVITE